MTTSRLTCPALLCALVVVSLATCGCTSVGGANNKWATAWKKSTESKPVDPNHEEIVTYWGQKKKQTTRQEMPAELKERLAKKTDPSQRSREYTDNFKAGNLRLKEGRLDEAGRAYELALAAKPDDPDVHHRLAVVADKQQLFGAADDHYEAALRQRPRDPNLLSDIGYSHTLRGDDRRAEQTLREALALDSSHKGAMHNLSTLYGKQKRYDDALSLLKSGTTEAETRQYMAQLFPQGPPSEVAQASNQSEAGQRPVRPIAADARSDVRNMPLEQLKAEMERRQQLEGNQNRQPQIAQTPLQRDWSSDALTQDPRATQDQRPSTAPNSQPWMTSQNFGGQMTNPPQTANPGFGQTSPYSPQTQTATSMPPGVGTIPLPSNLHAGSPNPQLGSPMLPYPGTIPNGPTQQPGFGAAPSQGSLVAPPGTSPQVDFWPGASSQSNTRAFNPALPQSQSLIDQMGHSRESAAGGVSASQAAAQLGMSVGPGSLFPVVPSDPAPAGGMSMHPSVTPAYEQRFNSEFPQPPQYQNSVNQYAPTNVPNQGVIRLPGHDGSASNQDPPNWPGAPTARSNGTAQQGPARNDVTIAPSSPGNNMFSQWGTSSNRQQPTPNTGSGVVQAGGSSGWDQSSSPTADPLNTFSSDKNGGAVSRYAKTPWDDPTSQPGGSRPYNGAWPNNNSLPNGASSSGGSSANSLPIWNGGNGTGASMPSGAGSANGSTSNSAPQQWQYSPQR